MTDDEVLAAKLHDHIDKIMKKSTIDIHWFFSTRLSNGTEMFSGNKCPMCAIENAVTWAETCELKHALDEDEPKVH